jgi:outer membrane protein OmpA-like peptidoglycan-associated protein
MRSTSALLLAGALLSIGATPAVAQKAGAIELGVFGRYTKFESDLHFDNRVGIGGRLGVFVLRNLALEADASYSATASQNQDFIRYVPIHARLVYTLPVGGHSALLLGGGYVRNLFREAYRETESGAAGLLGLRLGMGEVLSLRLDGTADYIVSPDNNRAPTQLAGVTVGDKNWHLGAQAGLSFLFGARRDGDRDQDGVTDAMDQCPDTPRGEAVDAHGCALPKDADGDGVTDNLDRCPGTPAGDRVDATGCALPKDADGDGVSDATDRCPNTPAGTAVDATGCPKDADRDGVSDASDKCPNTPAGTPVDATGCPKDSDGDGVTDTLDRCPNTPAGTAVDSQGCAVDLDRDGVSNANDKCPTTPAGTKVDAVGCPALFEAGTSLVLQGVTFATGKATLLPESQTVLDGVAASLGDNPTVTVEVGGHTDNTGRRAANVTLSEARATAVRAYLIGKGVAASQLTAKGYGPDQPVADNTTVTGRAANRRVELTKTN